MKEDAPENFDGQPFELVPHWSIVEEQKNSLKMMLLEVLKCLSSCKLEQLRSCCFVVDIVLKQD